MKPTQSAKNVQKRVSSHRTPCKNLKFQKQIYSLVQKNGFGSSECPARC